MEEWRPVCGFEGFYEVSSLGRVRRIVGGRGAVAGRILSERLDRKGYDNVYLHAVIDGVCVRSSRKVHRLVATAFIGQRPSERHEVNHRDGVKRHNEVGNLEWVLPKENNQHALRLGLRVIHGEHAYTAKLTEDDVREIRRLKFVVTQRELARRYGVFVNTIKSIHTGRAWRHVEMPTTTTKPLRTTCGVCGHLMSGDNLYLTPRGERKCRTCARRRNREYESRRKGEAH